MNAPLPQHLFDLLHECHDAPAPEVSTPCQEDVAAAEPSEAAPRSTALVWPEQQNIALCVVGFQPSELMLLESLVRLSERRGPRLNLLPIGQAHLADVVMIDGADAEARAWGHAQTWLDRRAVIWVNGKSEIPTHTMLRRPVQWPMLPILLARSLRAAMPATRALAIRPQDPDAPVVMIVADDADARRRVRAKLQAGGLRTLDVRTAREGLAALHAAPYACVLLAGEVPDADRIEMCRRVRALPGRIGDVPLAILDEGAGMLDRLRARLAGCEAVMPEPARGRELRQLVETLAARRAAARVVAGRAVVTLH